MRTPVSFSCELFKEPVTIKHLKRHLTQDAHPVSADIKHLRKFLIFVFLFVELLILLLWSHLLNKHILND